MCRLRLLTVVAATLGALGAATLLLAPVARGAPAPSRLMTFIDYRSGLALTLQVQPAVPDAGTFRFRVPGRGLYTGSVGAAMQVRSPRAVIVHFEGEALLRPLASLAEPSAAAAPPVAVHIELQAEIDPARRRAQATLREDRLHFHLEAPHADPEEARKVIAAFEQATRAEDWATLYPLLNSDLRRAFDPASFAAHMQSEIARAGRVLSLRRLALSELQLQDDGAAFVVASYQAELAVPSDGRATRSYDVYFVRQVDGWKLWFSRER